MIDDDCLRFDVAVRAIWLLWRNGRWSALESLMLPRSLIDNQFTEFDLRYMRRHRLQYRQVDRLLQHLEQETREEVTKAAYSMNYAYAYLMYQGVS